MPRAPEHILSCRMLIEKPQRPLQTVGAEGLPRLWAEMADPSWGALWQCSAHSPQTDPSKAQGTIPVSAGTAKS